jgi:hypothetical protein
MARNLKRWQKWAIIGLVALVVIAVGGPLVYKLFNKADRKAEKDFTELADQASAATSPVTLDSLAGSWVTIHPASGNPGGRQVLRRVPGQRSAGGPEGDGDRSYP